MIDEEVYQEEEDEQPPTQYPGLQPSRRLTSGSFDSRVEAYLINQLAMRNAIDQMMSSSYESKQPNTSNVAQNLPSASLQPPVTKPKSPRPLPQNYRAAPYSIPYHTGFAHLYGSAYSVTASNNVSGTTRGDARNPIRSNSFDQGRMSNAPSLSPSASTGNTMFDPDVMVNSRSPTPQHSNGASPPIRSYSSPLATSSYTPEPAPSNAPLHSMFGSSSENYLSTPYYSWANVPGLPRPEHITGPQASYDHMSETISPSDLDACTDYLSATSATTSPSPSDATVAASVGFYYNQTHEWTNAEDMNDYSTTGMSWDVQQGSLVEESKTNENCWDVLFQENEVSAEHNAGYGTRG